MEKGDALFEVETDKATMEVEAQADGFLTDVCAAEGDDVLVGAVIARISDSAEDSMTTPAPTATKDNDDDLPQGVSVTMPQLGMAQDTGLLVSWQKALGDAVAADDVLFEVETDKSTMEVPAGKDGYLAATLVEAGQEVPVGDPVAIISKDKPEAPVSRSIASASVSKAPATPPVESAVGPAVEAAVEPTVKSPPAQAQPKLGPPPTHGRTLASPKARRLALEQGLDLDALAASGHPQPFHVADLAAAKALPTGAPAAMVAQTMRLTAEIAEDGLPDFAAWAARSHGLDDATALLAGLGGASLGSDNETTVVIQRAGQALTYTVPTGRGLSKVTASDNIVTDLILRDLRGTPIRSADLGVQGAPVLTIMTAGAGLDIALECTHTQLNAQAAITLLSNFAGRMEQPLRHLL